MCGAGFSDAATIIVVFNAIYHTCNITSVQLNSAMEEQTTELRTELGIDAFALASSN